MVDELGTKKMVDAYFFLLHIATQLLYFGKNK
jgi:hypothetical protein